MGRSGYASAQTSPFWINAHASADRRIMGFHAPETTTSPSWQGDALPVEGRLRPSSLVALALVALALVVTLAPQRPGVTTLLNAAAQQRAVYRYDRALALYAEAHAEIPGDPRPTCAEGETLVLQREAVAAAAAYQACVALAPGDAGAWLALGDALAATGRVGDDALSVAAWRRAAQLGLAEGWARMAER